jgi:hypothetical protein
MLPSWSCSTPRRIGYTENERMVCAHRSRS